MSEVQIVTIIGIAFISGISYYIGHKKGISNTVDFLEDNGLIEFEE